MWVGCRTPTKMDRALTAFMTVTVFRDELSHANLRKFIMLPLPPYILLLPAWLE